MRGHKGVDFLLTDVSMISAGSDDNNDDVIPRQRNVTTGYFSIMDTCAGQSK